jgi:hypothetical protein
MVALRRAVAIASLLAIAIWLGGLVALGAVAAPTVFAIVPMPSSADAMTSVFRRFDVVAMACAAVILAGEAGRAWMRAASRQAPRVRQESHGRPSPAAPALSRPGLSKVDRLVTLRAGASALAAVGSVVQGTEITPKIAALHAGGAVRGLSPGGMELARLHDLAEWCAKAQLVLLLVVLVAQGLLMDRSETRA